MPNTFTQLHVQFVFAVKYREALIKKILKDDLHRYITGIFQINEHKMLQVNSCLIIFISLPAFVHTSLFLL
jgi:putative transposase